MHHDGGAETRLIGKHPPLAPLGNGLLDGDTRRAARDGLAAESEAENRREHGADAADMGKEHDQRADDVQHRHERHDPLGDSGNALQAADDDQRREDHQHNAAGQRNHAHAAHGSSHAAEERGFHIQDDLIDLPHIADAEGCQNGKNGEQNRKDAADGLAVLPAAQTVFQIVHRTSRPLALTVAAAVVDAQHIFGEIGHHPEKGRNPHPEHRAGAADDDGCRHAGDIAGADGGGEGRTQRLKLGNGLFVRFRVDTAVPAEHAADGLLPPVANVGDLEPLRAAGHQNTRADQQDQTDLHPDKGVDLVIDLGECGQKILHTYPLFPASRSLQSQQKIKTDCAKRAICPKKQTFPLRTVWKSLCPFA